jgi:hypothetical protein
MSSAILDHPQETRQAIPYTTTVSGLGIYMTTRTHKSVY